MNAKKKATGAKAKSAAAGTTVRAGTEKTTATPKPAVARPAGKPVVSRKSSGGTSSRNTISAEERWNMIAEAAYYHAEKRGFFGGNPAEDWAMAEVEIDGQLAKKKIAIQP